MTKHPAVELLEIQNKMWDMEGCNASEENYELFQCLRKQAKVIYKEFPELPQIKIPFFTSRGGMIW